MARYGADVDDRFYDVDRKATPEADGPEQGGRTEEWFMPVGASHSHSHSHTLDSYYSRGGPSSPAP